MAILVRYIDSNWEHLIHFQLIAQSGEESRWPGRTSSTSLLAAMHDHASVNNVAIRTLKDVYHALIDIGCFSHTLDLVGSKFVVPHLNNFMSAWVNLFSHSPVERTDWSVCSELLTDTLVELL